MKLPKELKISKDFDEKAKNVFLNAYQVKFNAYQKIPNYAFRYFSRGAIAGVAFMLVISGTAVFADQQNVTPDNLLYPLKRSYESVNLALSSETEKPNVHLKYAERRLNEIKQIKKIDSQHEKVTGLVEDLRGELKESFVTLENEVPEINLTSSNAPVQGFSGSVNDNDARNKTLPVVEMTSSTILPGVESEEFKNESIGHGSGSAVNESGDQGNGKREQKIKQKDVCKSWQDFIGSEMPEIKQIIEDRPNFMQKFERGCLPITDSGTAPDNQKTDD